jgi:Na+/H+-dicarboxylate symporter
MKIWIKLVIGAVLGGTLGFLLPAASPALQQPLAQAADFAIAVGRYCASALLLFSLVVSLYELREDGAFWGLVGKTALFIVGIAALVIALAIATTLALSPERIPILMEQQKGALSLDLHSLIFELFPPNMLQAMFSSNGYLLPLCVLAFFLSFGLSFERNYTRPVLSLFNSLSRILYHISLFFSEVMSLLLIVLSAYWAVRYRAMMEAGVFGSLTITLAVFAGVVALGLLPALSFAVKKQATPWKGIYASLAGALGAFFAGDVVFTAPLLIQQTKENFGIRRRAGAPLVLLWTTFSRVGSAAVALIAFMVVVKSYSNIEIPPAGLVGLGGTALALSFLLCRNPGDGAFVALAVLAARYGHGFENGYLILKPLAFYLVSIGAVLDVLIASWGVFVVAHLCGFQSDKPVAEFM